MKWLGFALVLAITVMAAAIIWLTVAGGFSDLPGATRGSITRVVDSLGSVAFAVAGLVIVVRRRTNLVGWLLIGIAAAGVLEGLGSAIITNSCNTDTGRGCLLEVAVLADTPFYVFLFVLVGLFLLFPHGRLRTRMQRSTLGFAAIAAVAGMTAAVFREDIHHIDNDRFVNPWHTGWPGWSTVGDGAAAVLVVLTAVAVGTLIVRTRRSTGAEQTQYRWLAWAAGVSACGMVIAAAGDAIGPDLAIAFTMALMTVPVAIVAAITRNHLYDIDRLISRSVTYAIVILLLAVGFGAMIASPTIVLGTSGGDTTPDVLIAAATLVAFLLFNPLRRRVQSAVDKRFNRLPYDPTRVAEQLSHQVRDTVDQDALTTAWQDAAIQSLQPTAASVWMRGTP